MRYGYFDEANKEYVITRPDTPAPWANYLGSVEYGAIISNNATGYSFIKSGASGRLIRFRFNTMSNDQPGRYVYLRDNSDDDYWSCSWQPVCKPIEQFTSECHHGTAYTVISSRYKSIAASTTYYVPLDKSYEVWHVTIKNSSDVKRDISVFGACEFTNHPHYENDTVNLQYSMFINKTYFKGKNILQVINENGSEASARTDGTCDLMGESICRYFGLAGQKVSAFDGDRDVFIGNYRNYSNPASVVAGKCQNSEAYNGNSCGVLQIDMSLQPGETKSFTFILGGGNQATADEVISKYEHNADKIVASELNELKAFWHTKLESLNVKTPDPNFDNMVNVWNAYQCFITYFWSRAASFQYCGLRNGLGYRDTVQDIQGIIHLDPALAKERLWLMLSAQVSNGGGLPLVKFDHNPGYEPTPDDPEYGRQTGHPFYRADDALWLFPTVIKYIKESGDWSFIDEEIPYSDMGTATVYTHLKQAIQFSLDRQGLHGFPAGLHADWNDCLRLGEQGESMFVAFQLYYALEIFREFAHKKGNTDDIEWIDSHLGGLLWAFNKYAFEEDQFVRGFTEDGYTIGSKHNKEASTWLNPQSWAVISGAAKGEQAKKILDTVHQKLNTDHGVMLFYPPFKTYGLPVARMILFNACTKENAGIFSQPQGWIILAETMMGNGNRAYKYFTECNPASMNDHAEIRKLEPYVHGQATEGLDAQHHGRAHVHWLTGTASTVMVSMVDGILGLHPDYDGISINPCIPSDWKQFTIKKIWRGKTLNITVDNKNGIQKGVKYLIVNGTRIDGRFVDFESLAQNNEILAVME